MESVRESRCATPTIAMRRKDREITDKAELLDILRRCQTVRIGMVSEGLPYVVPMSFGYEEVAGQVVIHIHCAPVGRKIKALQENPTVCVEADLFSCYEPTPRGITARYESLIGHGTARRVEGEAKLHALRCLLAHCGYADYPLSDCTYLAHTAAYSITLTSLSGKRNLPEGSPGAGS